MAQPSPTDPTKMGVGRAIAVLTSGGDAQGEYVVSREHVVPRQYSCCFASAGGRSDCGKSVLSGSSAVTIKSQDK